ncbi:MAG: SPOR domain-containing protein [Acidobacteria bacterium]|nr:SPOR domain-containing protein [Acidobacteriota bacterium]
MEDQQLNDDSHYEISLTATQAFIAFVLLLLSLAASFAFGVMVGRGQLDPSAGKKPGEEATAITERPMPAATETPATETVAEAQPESSDTGAGEIIESAPATATQAPPRAATPTPEPAATTPAPTATATVSSPGIGPAWAQLLATSDAKRAEALAAKLIDGGFTSAFVDRIKGDKGTIHRVRVRFKNEAEARAAVPKLQPYTTEKVLVTTK